MRTSRKRVTTIRLDELTYQQLAEVAGVYHFTISEAIRLILRDGLREYSRKEFIIDNEQDISGN